MREFRVLVVLERHAPVANRFLRVPLRPVEISEVVEDHAVSGHAAAGAEQVRLREAELALAELHPAEAVEVGTVVGILGERPLDQRLRLFEPVGPVGEHVAEVVQGQIVIGRHLEDPAELDLGFRQPPLALQKRRELEPERLVFGPLPKPLPRKLLGGRKVSGFHMVAEQRVHHPAGVRILRGQPVQDGESGLRFAPCRERPRLERQKTRVLRPLPDQILDEVHRIIRRARRQAVLYLRHAIPNRVGGLPGQEDRIAERLVCLLVLSDLLQRLGQPAQHLPPPAEPVGVRRERSQRFVLSRRPPVFATRGEDSAEREPGRNTPAILFEQTDERGLGVFESHLLSAHHRETHQRDLAVRLRNEQAFEGRRGVVEPADAGEPVGQREAKRLVVGVRGGSGFVKRHDFGQRLRAGAAGDLAAAQQIVEHLPRLGLTRLDPERLDQVVEGLFPVAGGEAELGEQRELAKGVGRPSHELPEVDRRLLAPLGSRKQAGELRTAPEVVGIETHRLAERADAASAVGVLSSPRLLRERAPARSLRRFRSRLSRLTGRRPARFPVVPAPVRLVPGSGRFRFGAGTAIRVAPAAADLVPVVAREVARFRRSTGFDLPLVSGPAAVLVAANGSLPPEGYTLLVETDGLRIEAADPAGLFHAFQTIRQLLPPEIEDGLAHRGMLWELPAVEIRDHPRFPYRGLHLDVSRHFFGPAVVRRFLDLMARYKLNRFHWHLTDDQGWRIEIGRYPRLVEVGGFRRETVVGRNLDPYLGDGIPHGGFYTQQEIREVVAYAADRFVTVIPEIETPGHTTAALAAYPEFGCRPGSYEVATTWGVMEDILCPSAATLRFLEEVLGEVLDLFPGELIHLGGDEAPKEQWRASRAAQEVIAREGLADENELQGWFLRRLGDFLAVNRRRLVGWDEILEGGPMTEGAVVMSWRGAGGGIRAARLGHDAVMTPRASTYFDFAQGDPETEPPGRPRLLPLERAYGFEPVPEELGEAESARILGAQGQLWTEFIETAEHLEYMAYPRAIALAEVVWSPRRDPDGFRRRLRANLAHLDALSVNYRRLR